MSDESEFQADAEAAEPVEHTLSTATESKPVAKGHMSYEAWVDSGKDPEEYKGSRAWEKDGELLNQLSDLKRTNRERDEMVRKMFQDQETLKKNMYDKALVELKSQLRDASSVGDTAGVERIADKIAETRYEANKVESKPSTYLPEEYKAFVMDNREWFQQPGADNQAMTAYAIAREAELKQRFTQLGPKDILEMVEKDTKAKFKAAERKLSPSVESSSHDASPRDSEKRNNLYAKLPDPMKKQYAWFKKTLGTKFDEKAYFAALKDDGVV